ncbi:chemokine XC receptor 1-like [Xyrauchen texanus]|uniref:chemokine XC receptor 1-like n=1 Tax=Xyrauchen texanus TaxID=154827 RepID=UPI0022422C30|nr:chemokine XC receptor 1-like [Xyrauchen texanus]
MADKENHDSSKVIHRPLGREGHKEFWVSGLETCGERAELCFTTLMTIQRYMAVVHPLSDWEKCRGFSIAPIIVWILSGLAALPGSLCSKVMSHNTNLYCEYDSIEVKHAVVYLHIFFFFIAFCIMGFCHVRMFWTTRKSQTRRRHRAIKIIFCVGLLFFIGWAPFNIIMFLRTLMDYGLYRFIICDVSIRLNNEFYACHLMAFSHCCINPITQTAVCWGAMEQEIFATVPVAKIIN